MKMWCERHISLTYNLRLNIEHLPIINLNLQENRYVHYWYFCSLNIQVNNFDKMRKNQLSRFFLWRHFQDGRHITLFENMNLIYKCKLHVWPIFYTIFRDKDYDYAIKIEVKGHQTSLNVISRSQYHIRSRILIFEIIGPSNACTLASWAPLNWKKCRPCREDLVTVQCALWHVYFDNPLIPTCKTPVGLFFFC